jgi:hypothetical protein
MYKPGDNSGKVNFIISYKRTPQLYEELCNRLCNLCSSGIIDDEVLLNEEIALHQRLLGELKKIRRAKAVNADQLLTELQS